MAEKIGSVTIGSVGDQKVVISGDWVFEMLKQGVAAGIWRWYVGALVISVILGVVAGVLLGVQL